ARIAEHDKLETRGTYWRRCELALPFIAARSADEVACAGLKSRERDLVSPQNRRGAVLFRVGGREGDLAGFDNRDNSGRLGADINDKRSADYAIPGQGKKAAPEDAGKRQKEFHQTPPSIYH